MGCQKGRVVGIQEEDAARQQRFFQDFRRTGPSEDQP
jgi:hypothetical protein